MEEPDDIKFIFNGRVLVNTEELEQVVERWFGALEGAKDGRGEDVGDEAVLILHAVVRPPLSVPKSKGKKRLAEEGVGRREEVACAGLCCTVQ